jgi:5-methylcytosine-specific restriction endonuclease McrA
MVAQSILLLNASYEPLTVVTLARAVKLLLRDRAEAVSDEHVMVASAADTLAVPQVLRLKIYAHVPHRRTPAWTRHGVFERDDYTCAYCGRRYAARDLTVDHLIPVSQGGAATWGNTVAACPRCNQRKADRTPHEAGMKLLIEPKAPRTSYLVASGDVPAAWKVWIEL